MTDRKNGSENEKDRKLSAPSIYEIIREEGEEELRRPDDSLWWSGLAAGVLMSMSVVAEGLLRLHLPDTPWRPLVENFGYCVGFLIVILGRFQLFTENTITTVLPLTAEPSFRNFARTARLWGIVFFANVVGTLLFALAARYGGIFSPPQVQSFLELAHHFMDRDRFDMLLHGVPAGFLIAALVWMLPNAKNADFLVIAVITYLIALGDMAHVVAGSAEVFLLLVHGDIGLFGYLGDFLLPAFVGNVIGGTALFTLLAYGQVKEEV